MNKSSLILFLFTAITFLGSCTKEDVLDPPNYQNSFIGHWDVLEITGKYRPQNYSVEIAAGNNIEELLIIGLNDRPNTVITANLNGYNFSIPAQHSDSIFFSGNGVATMSFDQINIDFLVDDGWGVDSISAILIP